MYIYIYKLPCDRLRCSQAASYLTRLCSRVKIWEKLNAWTLCHIYSALPQHPHRPQCSEARESTRKWKKKTGVLKTGALCNVIWKVDQHGCSSAGVVWIERNESTQARLNRTVHFSFFFFSPFLNRFLEKGFVLNQDRRAKTRKNLIDYWNGGMNRSYKIPRIVGGRGAQKEEVFLIIHLSCRVLCSGKQLCSSKLQILRTRYHQYLRSDA